MNPGKLSRQVMLAWQDFTRLPQLAFVPDDWQVQNVLRLVEGQDLLCVSATGDGKLALMYMYAMVRTEEIVISILAHESYT